MKYRFLKSEEVQQILALYPDTPAREIAKEFGVPVHKIYATAKRYEVKKSPDFLASPKSGRIQKGQQLGKATQFKKGDRSATKGKRMAALIKTQEKLERWRAGLWKKGNKPLNTAKDGEIRWRPGVGYMFIRLAENQWEFYHKYIWELHNGPVAPGFNIVFKDRNRKNCAIENLECISNQELMARNSIVRYPSDVIQSMHKLGKLKRTIKKIENG